MPDQFLHGVKVIELTDGARPITTLSSSVIGLIGTAAEADEAKFPLGEPVMLTGPAAAAALGAAGTLPWAVDGVFDQAGAAIVVVRVEEGIDEPSTLTNIKGDAAARSGVHALANAKSELGVTPRILAAPGWTHQRPEDAVNPVATELQIVAERLRAVYIVDGPNLTDAEAITVAGELGDRAYLVDPHAKVWDAASSSYLSEPASGRVAGVIARTDAEFGVHHSPSNKTIGGVAGAARPITFGVSDQTSQASQLNEANVATIVRQDGFRLWGNRTCASDPLWAFLAVRRTADIIYDSVEAALLWAIDRPFSQQLLRDVAESVEAYLRRLKAGGAVLGGRVWLDPELNTAESLAAGKLYLDFDFEPAGPLEGLTVRARRNGDYYDELVNGALSAA